MTKGLNTTFELRTIGLWTYYALPELHSRGIVHGFFTARCPSHTFIDNDRLDFLDGFHQKDLIVMDQEHGDEIHTVGAGERPCRGDGLILVEKNVAGIIKTADCLPVIIADPVFPMAAIIHAGWKGTAKRIVEKAANQMIEAGAKREDIFVLFGPAIRPCCYQVGEEVRSIFMREGFGDNCFSGKGHSVHLDLVEANREQLARTGITERVFDTGLCTCCSRGLFSSFRRGERIRRQINFVSLQG